jgi:iron complex transport system substrate-binding protein
MRHVRIAALAAALALLAVPAGTAAPKPAFPVTLTTAAGKVTLAKQPTRIVSLSPSATEDLYAVGAGPQVVAVDDQSNYPANAPRTKLSGYTPNAEAIAAYRPDLVVLAYDTNGIVAALRKLGIPVLREDGPPHLNAAYAQMLQLGRATGHLREAYALVHRLRSRVRAIVAAVPKGRQLSVYHELEPDYYSASTNSFIGRVYRLFGLRDIADEADKTGSGYPQLSPEYIVAQSPDLIVLADTKCCHASAASVAARPGWANIAAVRNGHVIALDDDVASRWGPRIVDFIGAIGKAVTAARQ